MNSATVPISRLGCRSRGHTQLSVVDGADRLSAAGGGMWSASHG